MKPLSLGCLVLLLASLGCKQKAEQLAWNLEPFESTGFAATCIQTLPSRTSQMVDKKLCKDVPLPESFIKEAEGTTVHCKPISGYVWVGCDSKILEMVVEFRKTNPQ